mgnify:CR=1 FL=1
MTATFMHIGRFNIRAEDRDAFINLMREYENSAPQDGLDHSHLIEDETAKGTFMHVTVWDQRDHWVAVEETPVHKDMHEKRNKMLNAPMEHDFVCGSIEI